MTEFKLAFPSCLVLCWRLRKFLWTPEEPLVFQLSTNTSYKNVKPCSHLWCIQSSCCLLLLRGTYMTFVRGVFIWRMLTGFAKNVSILPILTTTITVLAVTGLRCFRAVFVNLRKIFGNPQIHIILLGRPRLTIVVSFAELRAIYRLRAVVLFSSGHARKVTVKLCELEKWMRSFSRLGPSLDPSRTTQLRWRKSLLAVYVINRSRADYSDHRWLVCLLWINYTKQKIHYLLKKIQGNPQVSSLFKYWKI